ncbi:3-dehydroquinate synthase [Rickettsiales bacterium LUAb2]
MNNCNSNKLNNNILIGNYFNLESLKQNLNTLSAHSHHIIIFDSNIDHIHINTLGGALAALNLKFSLIELNLAQHSKNLSTLEYILGECLKCKINRSSVIIAVGGGTVGDLAGFSASILLRGIKYINIPTSLLAAVDSSIGGKTGIDHALGKNLIGSFHIPSLVIIDNNLLNSLPPREILSGFAEIIKYSLIIDKLFWDYLITNYKKLFILEEEFLTKIIHTSCEIKQKIVKEDPFETKNIRTLLNFGHTFGHALEKLNNYDSNTLLHGEAVAIGINMAVKFSHYLGYITDEDTKQINNFIEKLGFALDPQKINNFSIPNLINAMRNDKKNYNQNITLILLKGIGKAFVANDITSDILTEFLTREYK